MVNIRCGDCKEVSTDAEWEEATKNIYDIIEPITSEHSADLLYECPKCESIMYGNETKEV